MMDEPHSTWYRSVTPDGKVWCESSDPQEVIERSEDKPDVKFYIHRVRLVSDGWVEWK